MTLTNGWMQSNNEHQLKLKVKDVQSFEPLFHSIQIGEGFKMITYDTLVYNDLYLDTEDFQLYKSGFSLRFRRKELNDNSVYSFQLKSEANLFGVERIEVDQFDLDIYEIEIEQQWVKLVHGLDAIFDESSENVNDFLKGIAQWCSNKYEAPLAPFQKLRELEERGVIDKVFKLKPVLKGISFRTRSHVVNNRYNGCKLDKRSDQLKQPKYFKEHKDVCWLMETSFDRSIFEVLHEDNHMEFEINEFEIENKASFPVEDRVYLYNFSTLIASRYGLVKEHYSKYKQVISATQSN